MRPKSRSRGGAETAAALALGTAALTVPVPASPAQASPVALPPPRLAGQLSIEAALARRRSVRRYSRAPVALAKVGQVLWAMQGETGSGRRTAPSAGALYPLHLYLVAVHIGGLARGLYRYRGHNHSLEPLQPERDPQPALSAAALEQESVASAPAIIVVAGEIARTRDRYGARAERYVCVEAGHAAQNACLQATALKLGAVTVGAFIDSAVGQALALPPGQTPLYLIPLGHPGSSP